MDEILVGDRVVVPGRYDGLTYVMPRTGVVAQVNGDLVALVNDPSGTYVCPAYRVKHYEYRVKHFIQETLPQIRYASRYQELYDLFEGHNRCTVDRIDYRKLLYLEYWCAQYLYCAQYIKK